MILLATAPFSRKAELPADRSGAGFCCPGRGVLLFLAAGGRPEGWALAFERGGMRLVPSRGMMVSSLGWVSDISRLFRARGGGRRLG